MKRFVTTPADVEFILDNHCLHQVDADVVFANHVVQHTAEIAAAALQAADQALEAVLRREGVLPS